MNFLTKFWNNFKAQPDICFFYLFLATFALTIRKVLYFFPISGSFNEYTGIYLYLSDIFLVLTIIAWVITIIYNKITFLSIYNLKKSFIIAPFLLVAWSFLSIFWSENVNIALFKAIKLFEFYLLYVYVILRFINYSIPENSKLFHLPEMPINKEKFDSNNNSKNMFHVEQFRITGQAWNNLFKIIIVIGLIQSVVAVFQFLLQKSVGLFWLKESLISANLPGVAKIIVNGDKIIRSYGLFPHPNILGGFLLFSIFITLFYARYSRVNCGYKNVPPARNAESGEEIMSESKLEQIVPRGTIPGFFSWTNLLLLFQCLALILTFSKSAILGLFVGLIYLIYKNVPSQKILNYSTCRKCLSIRKNLIAIITQKICSTWNNLESRDRRGTIPDILSIKRHKYFKVLTLIFLISIALVFLLKIDLNSFFIKSLEERSLYFDVSPVRFAMQSIAGGRGTEIDTLIFGIGSGQFVNIMQNYSKIVLESWQFQPVHNVFLLIWSELGIIGLILFIFWIYSIFKSIIVSPVRNVYLKNKILLEDKLEQNVPRGTILQKFAVDGCGTIITGVYFKAIFIGFLFIMFFDHYLWDIQQGQIMLWMVAGLIISTIDKNK